jgi:16S rRNA G1207 methylase RsmC
MTLNISAKAKFVFAFLVLQLKQEAIHGKYHLILLNPPAEAGGNSLLNYCH